jgi:hypothetical protein
VRTSQGQLIESLVTVVAEYSLVDGYDGLFVQITEVQRGCLKRRIRSFKRKFKLSTFGAAAAKAT